MTRHTHTHTWAETQCVKTEETSDRAKMCARVARRNHHMERKHMKKRHFQSIRDHHSGKRSLSFRLPWRKSRAFTYERRLVSWNLAGGRAMFVLCNSLHENITNAIWDFKFLRASECWLWLWRLNVQHNRNCVFKTLNFFFSNLATVWNSFSVFYD